MPPPQNNGPHPRSRSNDRAPRFLHGYRRAAFALTSINRVRFSTLLKHIVVACAAAVFASNGFAEMFSLTDNQGRSIKANVLSVTDNEVKIKREDGQIFTLSLSILTDADQAKLKNWAAAEAKKPQPIPQGALTVSVVKKKGDVKRSKIDSVSDGQVFKNHISVVEEQWGYSIDITNKTDRSLSELRAEYVVFATAIDPFKKDGKKEFRTFGKSPVPDIPKSGTISLRTNLVTLAGYKLPPGGTFTGSDTNETRDKLDGVWVRIYRGEELLVDESSPDSIRISKKWGK